jgi:hypothetical protein
MMRVRLLVARLLLILTLALMTPDPDVLYRGGRPTALETRTFAHAQARVPLKGWSGVSSRRVSAGDPILNAGARAHQVQGLAVNGGPGAGSERWSRWPTAHGSGRGGSY